MVLPRAPVAVRSRDLERGSHLLGITHGVENFRTVSVIQRFVLLNGDKPFLEKTPALAFEYTLGPTLHKMYDSLFTQKSSLELGSFING